MLKISIFFDVIYWRTALWRLSLGYTSKLDYNIKKLKYNCFIIG